MAGLDPTRVGGLRPVPLDIAITAVAVVALTLNLAVDGLVGSEQEVTALTYVLTALAPLPLLVRTRRPLHALFGVAGVLVLYLATDNPVAPLPVLGALALYSVAVQRDRRTLVLVMAALPLFAGVASIFIEQDEPPLSERLVLLSAVLLVVVVGDAVRSRRALAEAYEEQLRLADLRRESEARRQVGEERRRIARDLHDVVAHGISTINVQAGVAAHVIDEDPAVARDALVEIKEASRSALGELRATLSVLRSDEGPTTAPAPGLDELPALVENGAATVGLVVEGRPARPVDPAVGIAGYRIVQEAITNIVRHAAEPRGEVTVRYGTEIAIEITSEGAHPSHDGPDGDPAPGGGFGIVGMRERASSIGGHLEAGPTFDDRFVVSARLPYEPAVGDAAP